MRRGLGWFERRKAPAWLSAFAARWFTPVDGWLNRVTRGRVGFGPTLGAPSLLLVTVGRTTGRTRRSPLLYVPEGRAFLVAGSNFGKPHHPGWTANLLARPQATVVVAGRSVAVTARLLAGDERAAAWRRFVAMARTYEAYADRTARTPRVFRLEPTR